MRVRVHGSECGVRGQETEELDRKRTVGMAEGGGRGWSIEDKWASKKTKTERAQVYFRKGRVGQLVLQRRELATVGAQHGWGRKQKVGWGAWQGIVVRYLINL